MNDNITLTHVFVCTNQKTKGKHCASFNAEAAFNQLREAFNTKRHLFINRKRVKVVKTSCLGQCAAGPNIFISPDNIWYTFSSLADLHELIDVHFVQGKTVERLLNPGISHECAI